MVSSASPYSQKNTTDKHGVIRYDLLFSYWMMTWLVLYLLLPAHPPPTSISFFLKKHFNPLLAFYLGTLENLITLILIFIYHFTWRNVFAFIGMILVIKVLPIWILWKNRSHVKWVHDTLVLACVLGVYALYLWLNNTSVWKIYHKAIFSIVEGRNETPLYHNLGRIGDAIWK